MPRAQEKTSETVKAIKNIEKTAETPEKKPHPLRRYAFLYRLRSTLGKFDPKLAKNSDRVLGSAGYAALLVGSLVGSVKLTNLSALISEYRMISRVYYTPATIEWALSLLLDNKQNKKFLRYSDYIQAVAGVAYQLLEDVAYLAMKGVISVSVENQAHIWVVSCWFWTVHVALELAKIGYLEATGRPWSTRDLVINLAWAPLTYHWSTYTGVVGPKWVGLFGGIAQIANLQRDSGF